MAGRKKRLQSTAPRKNRSSRPRAVGAARGAFSRALGAVMQFLDALERPSAIIGGVAVIAHGFARTTADIDACVAIGFEDLPLALKTAQRSDLRPRVPDAVQFARENLVLLLEHRPTGTPVDVSIAQQPFEIESARRAQSVNFAGVSLRIVSVTALIIYKMLASRPQDLQDVEALLAGRERIDRREVESVLSQFDRILELDRLGDFRRLSAKLNDAID